MDIGRTLVLLPTLAALTIGRAAAQALVTGFVRADPTERPIWNADVLVDSGVVRARTGVNGQFFLRGLAPGRHHILARAIGFKPITVEIDLAAHDSLELEIRLTRLVQQLAPVAVEGKTDRFNSGKMADFDRRRSAGFGKFIDRTELAKWDPLPVSDALRRLAGVQLRARPLKCGGGFAAATARGGNERPRTCDGLRYPPGCYLTVFLDGVRIYTPPDPDPPNVDELMAAGLEAVEVYRGSGELPAELGGTGSPCGAIVFWTRTGEDQKP